MDIAASIRMGLAKKSMQQGELADALGVRRETVSSWCNSHSHPGGVMQSRIADVFSVSVSDLIKWGE